MGNSCTDPTLGSTILNIQCLNMRKELTHTQATVTFNFKWTTHRSDLPTCVKLLLLQLTEEKKIQPRSQKISLMDWSIGITWALNWICVVRGHGFQTGVDLYFPVPMCSFRKTWLHCNSTSKIFNCLVNIASPPWTWSGSCDISVKNAKEINKDWRQVKATNGHCHMIDWPSNFTYDQATLEPTSLKLLKYAA